MPTTKNLISLLLITVLLGATLQSASAQDVIYSTYDKYDAREGDNAVVGKVQDQLFTYRADRDGYYLDAWDDNMNKQATIILDFFPVKIQQTQFITYTDKIIVLYQANEKGVISQYAAKLDSRGLLQGAPIKIASEKTGFFGSNRDFFSVAISDDKNCIVIYTINSRRSTLEISGKAFDNNLVMTRQFNTTYKGEESLTTGSVLASNNGGIFLTAYSEVGNRDYAEKVWLLHMNAGDNKFGATALSMKGKYAASSYMKMDAANEKIYMAGFYSDNRAGNYDGGILCPVRCGRRQLLQ